MSVYKIAIGFDQQTNLVEVSPQPRSGGIRHPKLANAISGLKYFDGFPYVEWIFEEIVTPDQLDSLFSQFGLDTITASRQVTVQTITDVARTEWGVFNAVISQVPDLEFRRGFWYKVRFRLDLLEQLS